MMKMSPNHLLTAIDDRDLGEARLDNRLCLEPGLLIEVFRLRYFAYAEKEYIAPNSQAMFLDGIKSPELFALAFMIDRANGRRFHRKTNTPRHSLPLPKLRKS